MTLNGLEKVAKANFKKPDKVNVVIYADDWIITSKSKEVLEELVKPRVVSFLKERGLELSEEKTKLSNIEDGFDFLGHNIRKYKGILLIKPSEKSVKTFPQGIRETIKSHPTAKTENLIRLLNAKILGWANYFRHVVSKTTFSDVDYQIYLALTQWHKRRHPNKSLSWQRKKYYRNQGLRNWIFSEKIKDKEGNFRYLDLVKANSVPIKRHIKIQAKAHPFDPKFTDYFRRRGLQTQGRGKSERTTLLDLEKGLQKA